MSKQGLIPKYENVKDYYGKAHLEEHINTNNDVIVSLYSYDTLVAWVNHTKEYVRVTLNPSYLTRTTMRHIKEFLRQEGFKVEGKNQILRDYGGLY